MLLLMCQSVSFLPQKIKKIKKIKNISFFPPSVLVGFRECWSGPTSTDQLSDNPEQQYTLMLDVTGNFVIVFFVIAQMYCPVIVKPLCLEETVLPEWLSHFEFSCFLIFLSTTFSCKLLFYVFNQSVYQRSPL